MGISLNQMNQSEAHGLLDLSIVCTKYCGIWDSEKKKKISPSGLVAGLCQADVQSAFLFASPQTLFQLQQLTKIATEQNAAGTLNTALQ